MHQTDYTNKDKTITDVWRADDWYRYLMRVSRDKIMSDSDISKYYPVDLITKDIIKKRYLAQQRKKTYDSIIMSHTSALPDHLKPQLLEKIQKKELLAVIVCVLILMLAVMAAGVLMFLNYDKWDYKGFTTVTIMVGILIIGITCQYYLMGKMIRDAIIRACMTKSNE